MGAWDQASMRTLEGRIKDVIVDVTCMGHGEFLSLQVTVDGRDCLVRLGPVTYVNSKNLCFALGETVRARGLLRDVSGEANFVASEVTIKGQTLRLRDQGGRPLWARRPKAGVS